MKDDEKSNITQYLDQVVSFINLHRSGDSDSNSGGGVLVHCKGGICRSASFLIAYLMVTENLSIVHAHGAVKEKRPAIRPRPCFLSAIDTWAQNFVNTTNVKDGKGKKKEKKKLVKITTEETKKISEEKKL
jgi:protein-tyrosine phosphatase